MDAAEPPRILVDNPALCADAEGVEASLRGSLDAARAPRQAWTVKMSVQPTGDSANRTIRGEGQITDENGIRVAERTFSVPGGDCRGLAQAVGVWSSLVLERERTRGAMPPGPASPKPEPAAMPSADVPWPAPILNEAPPPESDWYLHHEDSRDVELGIGGFVMTGAGAGAMAGAAPYAIIETGQGVFLRPSFSVGKTLTALDQPPISALWIAGRFDTCLRLPGLYTQNRGMQLDLCGGADVGYVDNTTEGMSVPYVSAGPSIDLRGELGGLLSVSLRGVGGVNLTTGEAAGAMTEPFWSGRLELAFSWKVK